MKRFIKSTALATHPGKVKDIWTGFEFYCYDVEKVVDYLNKMLEKMKEKEEKGHEKNKE